MDLTIESPENIVESNNGNLTVYAYHVVKLNIKDFSLNSHALRVYSSPVFKIQMVIAVEASIVLYLDNHTSIYMQCLPQYRDKLNGRFDFVIGPTDGPNCKKGGVINERNHGTLGWGGFIHYGTDLSEYIPHRTLFIECVLSLDFSGKIEPRVFQASQNQLSKDLSNLLLNEDLSDVTLKAGEQELKAHKNILSARSPVFNRMFKSDMAEAQLNTVEITDMDFEVLKSVLEYMYTDHIDVDKNVEEILVAAEKYQLEDLKYKCQEALAQSLTVENAAHIFHLSDLHRAGHLKAKVIYFINCNKKEVLETEEMKLLIKEHPYPLLAAFLQIENE